LCRLCAPGAQPSPASRGRKVSEMRQQFRMSEEQYGRLVEASKPVPYMVFGGMEPISPREKAEAVWRELGDEMGFDWTTVEPPTNGDNHSFSAVLAERAKKGGEP